MQIINIDKIIHHYLHTALWTGELDGDFDIENIEDSSLEKATNDVRLFVEKAGNLLIGLDPHLVGHDFWLTRNHHGAGFWYGDYEKSIGEQLTKISQEFNGVDISAEDGLVFIE